MRKFTLTLLISLMLSGDMALMIAAIWQILALDGGYIKLGISLACMAIVPAVLQTFIPSISERIQTSPHVVLRTARATGIVIAGVAWSADLVLVNAILIILACFSAVLFFTQQSLEVLMLQQVQTQGLSSQDASRILQVGMQLSTFTGMSIGGWLLHSYGMSSIFIYMLASLSLGFALVSLLPIVKLQDSDQTQIEHSAQQSNPKITLVSILLLMAMANLMIHNGSFNFYIPTLFNQVKLWDADSYGYFSAAISAGAMLTWFSLGKGLLARMMPFASTIVAVICCYLIVYVDSQNTVFLIAFALGYFGNITRLAVRQQLYENTDAAANVVVAKYLTLVSLSIPALVPLVLGFSMSVSSKPDIRLPFLAIATTCFSLMAVGLAISQVIYSSNKKAFARNRATL